MPILRDWDLELDADKVLWGQGADAAVIRARKPALAAIAERALVEGRPLLEPVVIYDRLPVLALRHEQLNLAFSRPEVSGARAHLAGPLIAQHLAAATEVWIAVCTVGETLTRHAEAVFAVDSTRALALDGLASAAAETLTEAFCHHVEKVAASEGLQTSVPLNPGMVGWPLGEGQGQVFGLLDPGPIGVHLTPSGLMSPVKSVSVVIGVGREMNRAGQTCDYCTMRPVCRYRERGHAQEGAGVR